MYIRTDVHLHRLYMNVVVLQALNGFLFVINSQGKVEFVSENVSQFLKFSQVKLLGKAGHATDLLVQFVIRPSSDLLVKLTYFGAAFETECATFRPASNGS